MKILKPADLFLHLQKLNGVKRGPLLGLDVGTKYVGVSISDNVLKVADPVRVLDPTDLNVFAEIQKLVSDHSLSGFIIGFPTNKQQPAKNASTVRKFVDKMRDTGKFDDMHGCYWDEVGTSKNVALMLKGLDLKHADKKEISDTMAAVGILQGYLDYYHSDKTKTQPWRGLMDPNKTKTQPFD